MKNNLHLLSRGAVFFAASSSLSLSSVVSAAETAVVAAAAASSDDLQPTRNSYASNRALMRDDEQPSEEPDVASIINGTATGGPLSYQVGVVEGPGSLPGCGGSLIAPRVVLTAAHCTGFLAANKVLINAYNLSSFDNGIPYGGGIVQASSYVIHPGWKFTGNFENDIALWFLPFPIGEDENFKFATLNEDPNVPAVGEELFASGWGRTVDGVPSSKSPVLLGTNLGYITNEQCQAITGIYISGGQMCAGGDGRGTGVCQGDSGGPLMIANGDGPAMDPPIQVGINSFVDGSCNNPVRDKPAAFTRVSSYIDWIHSTACEKVGELCPSSSKSAKGKSKSYKSDSP